jgi:hypothetical protein
MFRHEVPVDDQPHVVPLTHSPVAVAAARPSLTEFAVEFWCEHIEGAPPVRRTFQVFGTGHLLPEDAAWVGTCQRSPEGLVWHLYEIGRGQP